MRVIPRLLRHSFHQVLPFPLSINTLHLIDFDTIFASAYQRIIAILLLLDKTRPIEPILDLEPPIEHSIAISIDHLNTVAISSH